jgi:hypothetical protein
MIQIEADRFSTEALAKLGRAAPSGNKKCPDYGAFMVVLSYYFRKQFED